MEAGSRVRVVPRAADLKRLWVATVLLGTGLWLPTTANAESDAGPLRIHVVCQTPGRSKACPAFLLGLLDESAALTSAPLVAADVAVYFNTVSIGNVDVAHLRFVGRRPDLPESHEVTHRIDTRITDEAQRKALAPAWNRGLLPFFLRLSPEAVHVSYVVPELPAAKRNKRSMHVGLWTGGFYDWTPRFQSGSFWAGASALQVRAGSRWKVTLSGDYAFERRPPLVLEGGTKVNVNTQTRGLQGQLLLEQDLSPHVSLGMLVRGAHQDKNRPYLLSLRSHMGLSWDLFPSNDPRGNGLALAYLVGLQADAYHRPNVLNERQAGFATHGFILSGSVRFDTTSIDLRGRAFTQMTHMTRRYVLSLLPSVTLQLGPRVDLTLALELTKQAIPGPAQGDAGDLSQVQGQSYAEPLRVRPQFNLVLHWDRENAERNNRWEFSETMTGTDNL